MANPYSGSSRKYRRRSSTLYQQGGQPPSPVGQRPDRAAASALGAALNPPTAPNYKVKRVGGLTNPYAGLRQNYNTLVGPGGADPTPAYTARQAGASQPSAGTASPPPQQVTGSPLAAASMASDEPAMAAGTDIARRPSPTTTLPSGLTGQPQRSINRPGPRQPDAIAGGMATASPLERVISGGSPEVQAGSVARSPASMGSVPAAVAVGAPAADPIERMREQAASVRSSAQAANEASLAPVRQDLRSAIEGLETQAAGQLGPQAPAPAYQRQSGSYIGPNGLTYLASDTTGTGPIEQPRGEMNRNLPNVSPGDAGNESGITRVWDDEFGGYRVLGPNATMEPDGSISVRNPGQDSQPGTVILPSSGNSLGLRQRRPDGTVTTQSDNARREEALAAAIAGGGPGADEARDRMARMDAYRNRRQARRDNAQQIRTAAAGYQNYGQTGSTPVGMAATAMGGATPLYAATFGPNMSRSQALAMGRADIQDPTGEQRAMRRAMGMADPGELLGFESRNRATEQQGRQADAQMRLAEEELRIQDEYNQGRLSAEEARNQIEERRVQAEIDQTQSALDQATQVPYEVLVEGLNSADPRVRRMSGDMLTQRLGGTSAPGQVVAGTVLAPGAGTAGVAPVPQTNTEAAYQAEQYGAELSNMLGVDPTTMDAQGLEDMVEEMARNGQLIGPDLLAAISGYAGAASAVAPDTFGTMDDTVLWDAITSGDPERVNEVIRMRAEAARDREQRNAEQIVNNRISVPVPLGF